MFAPAGLPAPIAEQLNAAVRKSTESPESAQLRARTGGVAMPMSVVEARKFVADEVTRWARFVEMTGVKPE